MFELRHRHGNFEIKIKNYKKNAHKKYFSRAFFFIY